MPTPNLETLDEICALITGDEHAKFDRVKLPEQRVEIIRLALQSEANCIGDKIIEHLDNIDTRLSHVGNWFEKSRLYEP